MGNLPKKLVGKRVIIRFNDHSLYSKDPVICEITGIAESITDKEIIIRWWSIFDINSKTSIEETRDTEVSRLLQGTIIQWSICKPEKWIKSNG